MNESHSQGYNPKHLLQKKIAAAFGRKAANYDQHAQFQAVILEHIIKSFSQTFKKGQIWADLGCGSGLFSKILKSHGIDLTITGADISFNSLKIASGWNKNSFQGDILSLPLKEASLDGIVVSSVLQWIEDQNVCLNEFHRCLAADGTLLFSVFIDGSFGELNAVKHTLGLPIPIRLYSSESLRRLLNQCSFSVTDCFVTEKTYYFSSAHDAMKSIKNYGAAAMPGPPMTRGRLSEFFALYENMFANKQGVPVTYRAISGSAKRI